MKNCERAAKRCRLLCILSLMGAGVIAGPAPIRNAVGHAQDQAPATATRVIEALDAGWRFARGDFASAAPGF